MKTFPRVALTGIALLFAASVPLRAADPEPKKNGYTVNLQIEINEQGKPEGVTLVDTNDTSADDFLTKLAIAMAAQSEFSPRLKEGKAVKYKARVPFFFPIPDDEGAEANSQPKPRLKKDGVIQPAYPLAAAQAGEVGGAILELIVGADGRVTSVKVLRASKPMFGESAVQAVKQWQFVPAMAGDKPVETRWRLAVVFEANGKMVEDYKYRIPPRPSLGVFVIGHNENVAANPEPQAAPVADAAKK